MALFSTLRDNFNDDSRDVSLWDGIVYGGADLFESGGKVISDLGSGSNFAKYANYESVNTYDLTNNSVVLNVGASQSSVATTYLTLRKSAGEYLEISQTDLFIEFSIYYGPGSSNSSAIAYDATAHKWWKIANVGGNIVWSTSPDGFVWTTRKTFASSFAITAMDAVFGAASFGISGKGSITATFDDFNLNIATRDIVSTLTGSGTATLEYESASYDISSTLSGSGSAYYLSVYQALAQKDYEYRVFDASGNFLAVWRNEVISDFAYSQTINQAPSELTIELARSPETRSIMLDALLDSAGDPVLDNNSEPIYLQTETANAVGPDTDVQENYNIDVYAFYGGYETLIDSNGEVVLDSNSDPILVQFGFPNGKKVYAGYVGDYELVYGEKSGVRVLVIPHATEMSHYVFTSGGDTTVSYLSTDPVVMARDAITNYNSQGGIITFDAASMPLSGWVSSYPFTLQTTREVVDKTIELLPNGYYHYVHPGELKQYLLQKGTEADHTFYLGKHITELRLKKSITQLVNKVYFTGGDTGSGDYLYKYYEDATSISSYRPGLERLSDSRVTLASSAEILSESKIEEYKEPRYRTSVTITDAVYDIESINLGEMVAFKNTGGPPDSLLLQIVSLNRKTHSVTLDLDMVVPNDTKRLAEIKRNLREEQIRNIPVAPS